MACPTAVRMAALEAQQRQLLELVERLVAAQERTAAALERLAPAPAASPAPLRLVVR